MAEAAAANYRRIGMREVRIWAILTVGVAYWANIVRDPSAADGLTFASVLTSVLDNGAFDVFAWALVLTRCFVARDEQPASLCRIIATVLLGVIVLVPMRFAPAVALVLLGGMLFAGPEVPGAVRQMRLALFALALETVWMTSPLAALHVAVGSIDARVTALLLRALGQTIVQHGNVVENVGSQFSIAIWPGCSSLFPLADVALAFVVIVLYRGKTLQVSQFPWLLLSFAGSILLTEIRLVPLAWDEASYRWWHDGSGVSVYALAALGLSVVPPVLATTGLREPGGNTVVRTIA